MTNLVGTSASYAIDAVNGTNSQSGGIGVHGVNSSTAGQGVVGEGGSCGVQGNNTGTGYGVQGYCSGTGTGVYGSNSSTGYGVYGYGGLVSIYGSNSASNGVAVQGFATGFTAIGVYGKETGSSNGIAVKAVSTSIHGNGVWAQNISDGAAVYGENISPVGGTYGYAAKFVYAYPGTGTTALYLQAGTVGTPGNAFYAQGNAYISGYLSKAGGGFRIDHPVDPANKLLNHNFVESPEMMNVYSGTVMLDAKGHGVVTMPSYFEAANSDYRYQLTSIGTSQSTLYVSSEISNGKFEITGAVAGKVCWQVTGVRADAWAKKYCPAVEIEKGEHAGLFMHPDLFGHDVSHSIHPEDRKLQSQISEGTKVNK